MRNECLGKFDEFKNVFKEEKRAVKKIMMEREIVIFKGD